jgi:FlaA1/EpsC-like NDP-sugar epimerase
MQRIWRRRTIVFFYDACAIGIAWIFSFYLRFDLSAIPFATLQTSLHVLPIILLLQLCSCYSFNLYRGYWRFSSMPDLLRVMKAVITGSLLMAIVLFFLKDNTIPRTIIPLYAMLSLMLLGGARFVYRWLRDYKTFFQYRERVLIVGAGQAGETLVRDLIKNSEKKIKPTLFVDDAPEKQGREVHGVRVKGVIDDIPALIKKYEIQLIFIAMPTASSGVIRKIFAYAKESNITCRTLPGINDLLEGRVDIKALRDVSLEDLLGRDPVQLDWARLQRGLQHKVVLVSGGGGSIGAELCRQIAQLKPRKIILVEQCEYNLYAIEMELLTQHPTLLIESHLVSVTDEIGLQTVFAHERIDIIFHAAAYKHVPMLESQIRVAMQNNILGTYRLAEQALLHRVPHYVLISTDKAVNPTNVMGATKRAAEVICQLLNEKSQTKFITVRFGNVLGSAGSVVPLFKKQLAAGGPLTVTHPEVTRFFMTIPEACQLILQASFIGSGGEIFVLDMGEPVKIRYLAEQMIYLSGLTLDEIDIRYIGLRPGEKLYEELFYAKEILKDTGHQKLLVAKIQPNTHIHLPGIIKTIAQGCLANDKNTLIESLKYLVPEYIHDSLETLQTEIMGT